MDSLALAQSMRGSIDMLALHWLMAPSTNDKATAAGLPGGIPGYAIGRLGVLGDCDHAGTRMTPASSTMQPRRST